MELNFSLFKIYQLECPMKKKKEKGIIFIIKNGRPAMCSEKKKKSQSVLATKILFRKIKRKGEKKEKKSCYNHKLKKCSCRNEESKFFSSAIDDLLLRSIKSPLKDFWRWHKENKSGIRWQMASAFQIFAKLKSVSKERKKKFQSVVKKIESVCCAV